MFNFLKKTTPPASTSTTQAILPATALLTNIDEYAPLEIKSGFRTEEEVVATVIDILSDEEYDAKEIEPTVRSRVKELIDIQKKEQTTWPAITDCDKLDAAFAFLETTGIICRQDFSCCGTCGHGEIWDEMEKAIEEGRKIRGYTFYHVQGTQSATEGYGICLNYGASDNEPTSALAIADEICTALRAQGLKVEWNGTINQCVIISLDWKRRFKCEKA